MVESGGISRPENCLYYIKVLRVEFPWYAEVSSRVTRNAIDDLDNAFKNFFRRVKNGDKKPECANRFDSAENSNKSQFLNEQESILHRF